MGHSGQACWTHEFWDGGGKHSGNQSVWANWGRKGPST